MKNILLFTIVSLVLSPLSVCAQSTSQISEKELAAELDAYIRRTMEAIPDLPSVAMVVVKDDKPIFMQAYGMANKESGIKADANTLYYIASSTKSYMALSAALLDREGKIKLSDPITKYLPGVTFKTPVPATVTVRDLLTHTSALGNDSLTWRVAFSGEIDDADLIKVLAEGTTFDEPKYGKYEYTNLGYNIYGMMLKASLNKKWQDVLQEKVFDPLGMKQTTAYVSKAKAKKLVVADAYLFDPSKESVIRSRLEKQDNNMQSAGGIVSSINDLGRWLSVNMNNGKLDGKQVIPADVMQAVRQTPRHHVAGKERTANALPAPLEEPHQVRYAPVIDVAIGPAESPHRRVAREVPLHVLVDLHLQIDTDCAERPDHDVCAYAAPEIDIPRGIAERDVRRVVDRGHAYLRFRCAGDLSSITESRERVTSGIRASDFSALIAASVTGCGSFFTGSRSTASQRGSSAPKRRRSVLAYGAVSCSCWRCSLS